MTDFIVCIECNCKYDNKHIGRDFRYKADGKPFDTCAYCRGIKKPCHYTCDTCNKTRIHYDYILLKKQVIIIQHVVIALVKKNVKQFFVKTEQF